MAERWKKLSRATSGAPDIQMAERWKKLSRATSGAPDIQKVDICVCCQHQTLSVHECMNAKFRGTVISVYLTVSHASYYATPMLAAVLNESAAATRLQQRGNNMYGS